MKPAAVERRKKSCRRKVFSCTRCQGILSAAGVGLVARLDDAANACKTDTGRFGHAQISAPCLRTLIQGGSLSGC